ncbi:MAG: hypothetical protein WCX84_03825 [Syntrophales bacterium]|jgi:hypothetical protein|nr:hypothetical protein [Syntrophales bacterium]
MIQGKLKTSWVRRLLLGCSVPVVVVLLFLSLPVKAGAWGKVMVVKEKTNIRAKRSVQSHLKGSLNAGDKVRVDFYRDNWYAVFPLAQKERRESKAFGYVHAPRLTPLKPDGKTKKTSAGQATLVIKDIRYYLETDGAEKIYVELSRYAIPEISTTKGETPQLIMHFRHVKTLGEALAFIHVPGRLIRAVRSSLNPENHVSRIILELAGGKDYTANQKFYEAENLYALELKEDRGSVNP